MQYGTVTGRFLAAVGDTATDTDRNPDEVPLVGKVTFTADLPKGRALQVVGQKATILPVPITCTLDTQGYLVQNGVRSVNLIATDTDETNPPRLHLQGDVHRPDLRRHAGLVRPVLDRGPRRPDD
ncbi:hypothetical protein [Curtobacterium sp. MCJR17_043]|uniref:hypothetical protein n=1 Tax=Curtobacterium sp. MCJR17_043 TaxID=2175660 RepID=UPI0024DFEE03|nr:hypothetical protein [Curtobacterium sp. MCJR17_043]WIB34813.1 hypothetical protein DEJ15_09545 [Curtobacterium sp. MCJR17_043]